MLLLLVPVIEWRHGIDQRRKRSMEAEIYCCKMYGFVISKIACCAQEPSNGIRLCTVATNHCRDVSADVPEIEQELMMPEM
ncbi:hypothetical protein C5167_013835 [Papaver somniferum]|uniref:Uncharacterized protein n=1 Tax=Papaver somniferum TaxID=3469 RepID=A0A4Y7J2F4_PAPSO|nr:hypothetical protein C5167_013835 [Papaver somniferum]